MYILSFKCMRGIWILAIVLFFLQERDLVSTICLVPNRVDLRIGCYVTTVFYGG